MFKKDNFLSAKNYTNLYHASITIFKQILEFRKNQKIIITSNCISLIAGLSFYLLQNNFLNYCVNDTLNENNNYDIQFILTNDKNIINSNIVNYHFNYEGNEKGILCIKKCHQC